MDEDLPCLSANVDVCDGFYRAHVYVQILPAAGRISERIHDYVRRGRHTTEGICCLVTIAAKLEACHKIPAGNVQSRVLRQMRPFVFEPIWQLMFTLYVICSSTWKRNVADRCLDKVRGHDLKSLLIPGVPIHGDDTYQKQITSGQRVCRIDMQLMRRRKSHWPH